MGDYERESEDKKANALRSRAVAACAIFACTNASPQDCSDSITDGYKDMGVDIRYYRGSSETNDRMIKTLTDTPKDFWYFNNRIKILCDSFSKKPIYGDDRSVGLFTAHGISIVNGAQTVGCIGTAKKYQLQP